MNLITSSSLTVPPGQRPTPTSGGDGLGRRRFIQSAGALGAAGMLPLGFADLAGAAPIGRQDGVLVLITMNGGCDALDTVIPVEDSSYYSTRGGLALPAATTLRLDATRGLNPGLPVLKQSWDRGNLAVIQGVGDPNGTLSHFENLARIMAARTGEGQRTSGWLGRYIDGLPNTASFHGVSFGGRTPLVAQGNVRQALALEAEHNQMVDPATADDWDRRQIEAMAAFGNRSTDRGALADRVGAIGGEAIDLAYKVAPLYGTAVPEGDLVSQLVMAARIINADLGVRILTVDFGDFDGHAGHRAHHDEGMAELNAGIEAFQQELDYAFLDRVLTLAVTEFGRRPRPNRSGGTDHGSAATYLAIGSQVRGGIYGQQPSLTNLDSHGNQNVTVDYRSVFATVLDQWLDADATAVLGANYENLGFTHRPASVDPGPNPAFATGLERRDEVVRLYLAYFGRTPDASGLDYWLGQRIGGASIAAISSAFAASPEFIRSYGNLNDRQFVEFVYQNVLGRAADTGGLNHWTSELQRGVARGQIMTGFSNSPEYRTKTASAIETFDRTGPVARLYEAYFLRAPDRQGRDYWNSTGKPLGTVSQLFSESPEFQTRYGSLSDPDFVSLIYRNVLGRPAEGEGFTYWTGRLGGGLSRGQVMAHFSEGAEFVAAFKRSRG